MGYPFDSNGFGYRSQTQNIYQAPFGQTSNFGSVYNNGFSRLRFNVSSFLPGNGPFTTTQKAREISSQEFLPVLAALFRSGRLPVPPISLGDRLSNPQLFTLPPGYTQAWGQEFNVPGLNWNRLSIPYAF